MALPHFGGGYWLYRAGSDKPVGPLHENIPDRAVSLGPGGLVLAPSRLLTVRR